MVISRLTVLGRHHQTGEKGDTRSFAQVITCGSYHG